MKRTFTRTITVEVTYHDPYGPGENAWDGMDEYGPDEMIAEEKDRLPLGQWFTNTEYTLLSDEWDYNLTGPGQTDGETDQERYERVYQGRHAIPNPIPDPDDNHGKLGPL